jgi:hypothetical protein
MRQNRLSSNEALFITDFLPASSEEAHFSLFISFIPFSLFIFSFPSFFQLHFLSLKIWKRPERLDIIGFAGIFVEWLMDFFLDFSWIF